MPLLSSLVAKLETPTADGKKKIGSAYPIAPGYIITAYHIFPDITDYSQTRVIWERNDDARARQDNPIAYTIDEIVYDSEKYDVVIAACKTPEDVTGVQWCRDFSELTGRWSSIGYPATGKDDQLEKRLKDPAGGTFAAPLDDDWFQQLESKSNPADVELWRGMSGAAVFLKDMDRLAAVIVETPRHDKHGKPVRDELLYSVSIPYLFKHCDKFRKAVGRIVGGCAQEAYACFKAAQLQAIGKLLSLNIKGALHQQLWNITGKPVIENSNSLRDALYEKAERDPLGFLKELREQIVTSQIANKADSDFLLAKDLYLLFLGVLLSSEHFVFAGSIHDLQAKTRLAAELQLAGRYNKPPKLIRNPKAAGSRDNIVGVHAIDAASLMEVGWDPEKVAETLTKVVDKAVYKAKVVDKAVYTAYGYVNQAEATYVLEDFDVEALNEELLLRRDRTHNPELIRLEVDSTEEMKQKHPLHSREVCEAIQRKLSNLIIARYGHGTMSEEAKLLAETRQFFNLIEGEQSRVG